MKLTIFYFSFCLLIRCLINYLFIVPNAAQAHRPVLFYLQTTVMNAVVLQGIGEFEEVKERWEDENV